MTALMKVPEGELWRSFPEATRDDMSRHFSSPSAPGSGEHIEALDVKPLNFRPDGAVAVDALAVPRRTTPPNVS